MSIFFKHKEKKGLFLTILLLFIASASLFAMESTYVIQQQLKGKVTDESGEPLPGVSVIVKGTKMGTQTDFDGKYIISVKESDVLVFSYVGMQTQEVSVEGKTSLDIVLSEVSNVLEDIVVVGYGTQAKQNLATTQTTIKSRSIQNRGVVSLGQALQGLAPNLNISPDSGGGEPGTGVTINIRGYASINSDGGGSPLILVDGMEQDINNIDPNDIASVTVLEDISSSAIYGARGAFGVILIETKGGSGDPVVKYTASTIASQFRNVPNMLSSVEMAMARNAAHINNGASSPEFSDAQIERMKANLDKPALFSKEHDLNDNGQIDWNERVFNVNYFKAMFKDFSFRFQNNLSVSGGLKYGKENAEGTKEKKINYNITGALFRQGGQYKITEDGYTRNNIGLNVNVTPVKWLTAGVNIRYASTETRHPELGSYGWGGRGLIYHDMLRTFPSDPVEIKTNDGTIKSINNLYSYVKNANTATNNRDNMNFQAKFQLEPVKNWKTFINYRLRTFNSKNTSYIAALYNHMLDGTPRIINGTIAGRYTTSMNNRTYESPQVYSQYEVKLPQHYFRVMVGFEQEEEINKNVWGRKFGVVSDEVPSIDTAVGNQETDESKSHWSTRSAYASLNYTFNKKYILNGTYRYDGSSKFIKEKRYGSFYSFGLGYNLENESFIKPFLDSAGINKLKLKFSIGQVGNQNIGLYQFIERIPIRTRLRWLQDGQRNSYATAPSATNENATWETLSDTNFGFELTALNSRLQASFNYFIRTTRDMLGPVAPLPSTFGTSAPRENSAELQTNGWGLTLKWNDKIGQDWEYNLTFLLSDAQSEITKYYNPTNVVTDWYVGQKYGEIWGYETLDIMDKATADKVNANSASDDTKGTSEFPNQRRLHAEWSEGDIRYKDLNGDGKITPGAGTVGKDMGDRKIIGNSTPRYNYSLDATISYKNLSLRLFFQGVGSRQIWLNGTFGFRSRWQTTLFKPHLDYWTEDNKDAFYPKPYWNDKNRQIQTKYLADASYIRLKAVNLSYNFDSNLLSKTFLKNAAIFLTADNLYTITNMVDFVDPELTSGFWGGAGKSYPLYRTYSLGISVTF